MKRSGADDKKETDAKEGRHHSAPPWLVGCLPEPSGGRRRGDMARVAQVGVIGHVDIKHTRKEN